MEVMAKPKRKRVQKYRPPKKTLKPRLLHPLEQMTASAFTAQMHDMAKDVNGNLHILDTCPSDIANLPAFLSSLTAPEVACGFKACVAEVLSQEFDSRHLLTKKEACGIIAHLLRSLAIFQDKLIEVGFNMARKEPHASVQGRGRQAG